MSAEVWRPVPGYEEIYSVSDQGNSKERCALAVADTLPSEWPADLQVREWPEVRHG